jgi:hypothetical protein
MPASGDRFYQLELAHRSALWGDIGSLIKTEGLVVAGNGERAILMLPDSSYRAGDQANIYHLSTDEWSEYLRRSDDPEILVMPVKAFHRKLRYEISGHVQQKIWVADGLKCMFCLQPMGKVQLTIDHFIPLELGGVNLPSNYLSACRRCNKNKGSQSPEVFCAAHSKVSYQELVEYLANRITI